MFKLNKKVKYALIALKHMHDKKGDGVTSAKEICDHYQIPFDPTARALQLLAQEGIVQACQGAHGGYKIKKDLNILSLKDLNSLIMGPVKIANCLDDDVTQCECVEHCIVISPLLNLNEKINDFMSKISIGSIIKNQYHPKEKEIRKKACYK
ncbi:MAG: Rrf2 family transcriptional regulator [Candidatus Omnitrophota bacterium]